ncbi:C2 family cysteine protease [Fimbriiglobus ruber]|uniref:Calpain catalytic domain-containing protein n=1 Tax=Fimbriiglobus ruber TaxID=1908690 RepID=A0A225D8J3_9BACT|nr:C2 family cysteine protease [Fimbriiglobus ruber]OWK37920.1 hypothetical protein FRUB_07040 [Fimbriiglobus ruber]
MRFQLAACVLFFSAYVSAAEPPKAPPFAEVVSASFARWDRNKDAELTLDEINRAVIDPAVKGPEAAAVAALRRGMRAAKDDLSKLTLSELTVKASGKAGSAKRPDWNPLYTAAYHRIAETNRELFPKGKPTLDSVSQGRMGDCFCLAPLGAICHRGPDYVVGMITPKKDGTFDVRIGTEWVNVPTPTDAEIALSSRAKDDGIWVNVYEKAVGEWRMRKLPEKERPVTSLDLLTKGGSAGTMLAAVTGNAIERFPLTAFKGDQSTEEERKKLLNDLRGKLEKAFAEKRCVTTGTGAKVDVKTPNIHFNHAYAVIGYDRATDRVLVWNPHGQTFKPKGAEGIAEGYATTNGQFRIPLADFARIFAGLAFEVRAKE